MLMVLALPLNKSSAFAVLLIHLARPYNKAQLHFAS